MSDDGTVQSVQYSYYDIASKLLDETEGCDKKSMFARKMKINRAN